MRKELRIKVAEEINKHFSGELFNENHVKKFKLINKLGPGGSKYHHDIYAMQMGNLTIMVWINSEQIVVHSQEW